MTLSVVCFLWRDPDFRHANLYEYGPRYVNVLRNMLERHLPIEHQLCCVTDIPDGIDDRVRIVPMPKDVRAFERYYRKLYAYHPDAANIFGADRLLLIDLDTVIVRDMSVLGLDRSDPFIAWSTHPGTKARFNTSLALMDAGAFPEIWERFVPVESAKELESLGYEDGDQDWVSHVIGNKGATWARRGDGVEPFYQSRFEGLPQSASVVFFNGRRSPAMRELQQQHQWIADNWK